MGVLRKVFSTCEHQSFVYSRSTGKLEYVPCGKCNSCSNALSSRKSSKLGMVMSRYRYGYMFTLTYDNDHLPRCRYFLDKNGALQVVPIGRIADDFRYLPLFNDSDVAPYSDYNLKYDYMPSVENDSSIDEFGVVSRRDIQRFFKRFRYHINTYFNKINDNGRNYPFCYYISSEYGPDTLRPHYHAVVLFDSPRLLDVVPSAVLKSWGRFTRSKSGNCKFVFEPYANIDLTRDNIKLCDCNASKYVADYVSFNSDLPQVLRSSCFRPFSFHSSSSTFSLAEGFTKELLENVSGGSLEYRRARLDGGTTVVFDDIQYSSDSLRTVFRKCKGYRNLDDATKSEVYSFAFRHFDEYEEYVNNIYSYVKEEYNSFAGFLRDNPYYRYRSYLLRNYYNEFDRLLMYDDGVWYVSLFASKFVRRFPEFFRCDGQYPTDKYYKLIDRVDTLRFCASMRSFCDVYNRLHHDLGDRVVFAAYPELNGDMMPFYYRDFLTWQSPYRDLLMSLHLDSLVYRNGSLDSSALYGLSEQSLYVWQEFINDSLSQSFNRNKSKRKNNALLNGFRLIS